MKMSSLAHYKETIRDRLFPQDMMEARRTGRSTMILLNTILSARSEHPTYYICTNRIHMQMVWDHAAVLLENLMVPHEILPEQNAIRFNQFGAHLKDCTIFFCAGPLPKDKMARLSGVDYRVRYDHLTQENMCRQKSSEQDKKNSNDNSI